MQNMGKPLVVIATENEASVNIRDRLLEIAKMEEEERGFWRCEDFCMAEYAGCIVEIVPSHEAEYYVFASTHKSESGSPCFTAHTPGNWGDAELGGKSRHLNFAYGSKVKEIACKMAQLAGKLGWQTSVEVDHHGPSLETPVLFAEIGSSKAEWPNKMAGEIVAQSIVQAIKSDRRFPCRIGFGGSHYAPKFTPKIVNGPNAFGHIIPGYALERFGMDEEMVAQAIKKNVEPVESAEIDWKGVKGQTREKLIATLDSLGMKWERA
jgi:D-aminoacyl-tRNA deacylase